MLRAKMLRQIDDAAVCSSSEDKYWHRLRARPTSLVVCKRSTGQEARLVACNPKPLLSSILNYFKGRHRPQAEHASVNVYFPPAVAVFLLSRWLPVLPKIERLAPTVQTQTMPLGF